ncbi:hypothetical protein D9M69_486760 [compost metagenome]
MDLQHHLVRHQQQVGGGGGRVGRQQQLQRLIGDPHRGALEAQALEYFAAALLAAAVAAEAAGLAVAAVEGGDADAGIGEAQVLPLLGARAVEVELFMALVVQIEVPVHQARVGGDARGLLRQQVETFGEAGGGRIQPRRCVAGAVPWLLQAALLHQGVAGDPAG